MRSTPINEITRKIGSTIIISIKSDPKFLGDEMITCNLKLAGRNKQVPRRDKGIVLGMKKEFIIENDLNIWTFIIPSKETKLLKPDTYITDVRIQYSDGYVLITDPTIINLKESVS